MSSESDDLIVARQYIVQMTDYWNRNTNVSKRATVEPLVSTEEVIIKPDREIIPYYLERRYPKTSMVEERKVAQESPISPILLPRYSKEQIEGYFFHLGDDEEHRLVLPADYIRSLGNINGARLSGVNNIHRINFVTEDDFVAIMVSMDAASTESDLKEEIVRWLSERGVEVERTAEGYIIIDKMYDAFSKNKRFITEFINEHNRRIENILKTAPNKDLFLRGNTNYNNNILFVEGELEGADQKRRDFIDFVWRDRVGGRRNHYEILKIFFEKFAVDKLIEDKSMLSSDSALKRYIIKKYKGSELEKDFNVYLENFNKWMGNRNKKIRNVFMGHPESSAELKYTKKEVGGGYFEIEEINSLEVNSEGDLVRLNNNNAVFALTKYNEIVLIKNFREFVFCYQMKTSDILDTAYSDSYLNFLIISYLNIDISVEDETYSSRSSFAIDPGKGFREGEIPEPSNFAYEDSYAKVNLSYIKDQKSNTYILVGSGSYWPKAEEGGLELQLGIETIYLKIV